MSTSKSIPPVIVERFMFPKGIKTYTVPLYGGEVYFTTSREKWGQIHDYMTGSREGLDYANKCGGCVMSGPNPDGSAGYLVGVFHPTVNVYTHEISHLAIAVLDRAGVPIDEHTTEAFAYLIGDLAEAFECEFAEAANEFNAQQRAEEDARAEEAANKKAERLALKASESAPEAAKRKGARRGRS